ncbi:MAG: Na+:solute symporter [Flavobacteriales bacterium]|nr:Na+:solute symporter [Flavobacteriales bacterium]
MYSFGVMHLSNLDWTLLVAFFAISTAIGLYFRKRAGKSLAEFFLGGRQFPWYLAGVSMVATTFAADTPLAVTELVGQHGISGNWLWWSYLMGGMLTTFFFARLWRRAEILTEVEFIELRYSGMAAAFLRGFKAVYLGLFMNVLVIGWVNLALMSLLQVFFGLSEGTALLYTAGAMLIAAGYSSLSGLWGVAVTDALQFVIAMTGTVVLGILVLKSPEIGGLEGLTQKVPDWSLEFFPRLNGAMDTARALSISFGTFLAYVGMQWWASWYPGMEPGGGGYAAQRMMSVKKEEDALYATLFFQIAHYCLRPWPWILVGLSAMVLYPELSDGDLKLGYVMAMRDYLPNGWRGLLLVAFFAAYMSTISTQLNWGAGYLVNDGFKRFIRPQAEEKELVRVSRITTIVLMLIALYATTQMESISGVWSFLIECGAGLGGVLILRWYWWRINAWSEISATLTPIAAYALAHFAFDWVFPNSFFFTVGLTTVVWLVVTFVTRPESKEHLQAFVDRVRPGGWWPQAGEDQERPRMGYLFMAWIGAVVLTYSILFATGKWLLFGFDDAVVYLISAAVGFIALRFAMKKTTILQ